MPSASHKPGRRKVLGFFFALLTCPPAPAQSVKPPALMRANVYRLGVDLSAYWLSEKYDGVRAFWDGQRLLTRGGHPITAPAWFTAGWPAQPMDGELWGGRGRFETTVSTVRQQQPDDAAWRQVRFMVFDLPAHPGVFTERLHAYQVLVEGLGQAWVVAVPQERVTDHSHLMRRLDHVVRLGGEGLMLHRGDATYRAERNDDLLKVKTHEDAEARVIGHEPGRGKHQGRMGALLVQTPEGLRFRIGSGFTDEQREQPPPMGSWITYRFRGQNGSGLPRFATFVRVRTDADLNELTPNRP
jgi:DNA ligase 1